MTFISRSLPRSKPLRIFSITAAVLLGLVALGELAGWPFLRAPLAQQLSKLTDSSVSLQGDFRAQLLIQPGIAVDSVTMGSASAVKVPHLLQAEGFVVRWRWSDLWRSRQGAPVRLKRVEADQIDAHLVRLANGNASWARARSESDVEDSATVLPQIETLVLNAGTIVYRDEPLNIDLQVRITQSSEPDTPLPWRATASGRYQGAAVKLEAQAGPNLPLLMQTEDNSALTPLRLSGGVGSTQLDFDGATGALWAGQVMRGTLTLRGASLGTSGKPLGLALPDTPAYRMRGRIAREGKVWSLVTDDATVGSSSLTAAMQYNTATIPPTLAGRVGGRRLAIADLAPAIGADQPPRDASRVLPDKTFDLPSLAQMNANVRVDLAQLDFGTPSIAPMTDLKVHLTLVNSRLDLSGLSARVAGGLLTGSTRLQANQRPPQWEAALRLAEVDLQRWIRALNKGAASLPDDSPAYLSGTLNAKLSLTGQGNSVADILGSGNGRLTLDLVNGEISQLVTEAIGLDAAQALGMLIAGDAPLRLNCARAEAVIQDGVVKTRHAVLDNKDSTLYIQGGASLKTETLQLRVVADPKDFSPFSLRTPLNVTGTLKQLQVRPEASGLLARAAGALVLGALAPPAALLAFIDTGAKPNSEPCAPVKAQKAKTP
ncbi:AsmA family protein [Rhodoferax antarcticus]|uniref:AsmA family protein n=1 Tax=Rhodoferax antarcticus ANT.BR TaxID=1111071 RepID=A0A1Q8YI78_9BURK|nr:AsmA family protein [Rhodoferax antarcticus]OLP07768.1 asmA family protein [Rhodoferax antarcticus ANT.BR]